MSFLSFPHATVFPAFPSTHPIVVFKPPPPPPPPSYIARNAAAHKSVRLELLAEAVIFDMFPPCRLSPYEHKKSWCGDATHALRTRPAVQGYGSYGISEFKVHDIRTCGRPST